MEREVEGLGKLGPTTLWDEHRDKAVICPICSFNMWFILPEAQDRFQCCCCLEEMTMYL